MSILALVIATSGTSVAAAGLLGSDDIRNDSIKSVDVKDQNLKGRDIKNSSLGSMDVRDGSLKARDFAKLPTGPAGPAGPAGVGRWALVDASGAIIAQSGGFTVTAGYPVLAPTATDAAGVRANGNVYINAGEDLSNNGIVATIALQNTADQNGDTITNGRADGPDLNPEFSGEIAVAMCQPGVVNCAPPGTGNTNHLVVSPRLSDGKVTTDGNRKRFYVVVTGS
ncbi:hypothetical protein [Nocardioides sp.]|uniref:hypothetical protein n=1 Tax=Nocardioides sp. TaxID=35761 RepID=UPI002607DC4A|nr:hypothetical protein [Nocardioides sp.]